MEIISMPLTEADVSQIDQIELMFFAYRDFTADADRHLATIGFGRAHHRVVYFVNRRPGMTIAELLDTLGITKQSLSRVLNQLIEAGYVVQQPGKDDRRKRLLFPTQKGRNLVIELSRPQSRRIQNALSTLGLGHAKVIDRFLAAMSGGGKG